MKRTSELLVCNSDNQGAQSQHAIMSNPFSGNESFGVFGCHDSVTQSCGVALAKLHYSRLKLLFKYAKTSKWQCYVLCVYLRVFGDTNIRFDTISCDVVIKEDTHAEVRIEFGIGTTVLV